MKKLVWAALLGAGLTGPVLADPVLEAATLPDARSVAVGAPETVFATVMNSGDMTATNCRATTSYDDNSPTTLDYQTVDGSNQLTGTINTPVDIPAGGQQGFLLAVTASEAFSGTIPFVFECDNATALGRPGINDLVLTVETGSPPDLVTILASPSGDGVLRIPTAGGANAAGGAVINIGGGTANVTATPVLIGPSVNTSLQVDICETNPTTGACLAARSSSVDMAVDGTISTYTVFVRSDPDYGVPLYPEFVRVSVEFRDQVASDDGDGQPLRGGSSVAYTAPAAINPQTAIPLIGIYALRVRDEENDPGGRFQGDGIIAFDENGVGVGFMPSRFGDQVVTVNGTYDLTDAQSPSFTGTFEYLQYLDVRFNTGTGQLTFNYDVNVGSRGLYVFQSTATLDDIDAPSSRSLFSSATRVMTVSRVGQLCPVLATISGDDRLVFDAYLGEPPEGDRPPDFSIDIRRGHDPSDDPDNQHYIEYATYEEGVGGFSIGEGVFRQDSAGRIIDTPFTSDGALGEAGHLRVPDPDAEDGVRLVRTRRSYVADCDENGFVVVVETEEGAGYTIHYRRRGSAQ